MRTSNVEASRIRSDRFESEAHSIVRPKIEEEKVLQGLYQEDENDGWP